MELLSPEILTTYAVVKANWVTYFCYRDSTDSSKLLFLLKGYWSADLVLKRIDKVIQWNDSLTGIQQ